MIDALPLLLGPEGYQISRSVRLRSSASAYFNRTPASAGDRQKFTISFWMKRGTIGTLDLFTGNNANGFLGAFRSDNTLYLYDAGAASGGMQIWSARVFRDPSAWYHIVIAVDTTQATDSNRFKVYINGIQETISTWNVGAGASRYPSLNANFDWNNTNSHEIGYALNYGYFDGYFTEFNNVSGQQLDPSSFGETNAVTGVWQPKKYTGTYGTNGFYLNFSDNSAATAAAIGKDYSGNGNNWTPNNISVTAGVTYDSMLDVPTQWADGGNGRGNYCTFNPLFKLGGTAASTWALNGNLQAKSDTNASLVVYGTMGLDPNTRFYSEFTITNTVEVNDHVGIVTDIQAAADSGTCIAYKADGQKIVNGTTSSYGATYTDNDVIGIAVDLVNNQVTFYKNGTSQGAITGVTSATYFHRVRFNNLAGQQAEVNANWGQRPFAYTPPSGFKALNTLNLPTPTILKGNQYFDVVTRNGSSGPYTTTIDLTQGAMLWDKTRSAVGNHNLVDSVRGISKLIQSNNTNAEGTDATFITAFNNKSYTTGAGDYGSGTTLVDWIWQKGATQGFDIVTYTGNGGTQNISHNLGVAPQMMIVKSRSTAQRWTVFHTSISNAYIYLNETFAADTANAALRFGNNSAVVQPTSSVFTIGNSVDVNQNTTTYVAYLFAAVAGYSSAFSYTGNGSTDGPFIFLGFRPRWIMWKKTNSSTNAPWVIVDTARSPYNLAREYLLPNASDAETSVDLIDILSNGFKWRGTAPGGNNSGDTYIGFAMAESPFKFSLGR
jgi:hypothetical protein